MPGLLRLIGEALLLLSVCVACAVGVVPAVGDTVSPSLAVAPASGAVGGSPEVSGPLPAVQAGNPSHDYPLTASLVPVSQYGYTEKEYFFSGSTSVGSYTSRMVVRRPADPAHFSGTVIVEWADDFGNDDLDLLWADSAADIMRSGDAFVLVSAQTEGVYSPRTGLKAWNPKRYAPLSMPQNGSDVNEPASFQIFGQAVEAVRSPAGVAPLGGLETKHLIATGGSESAITMTTYARQYGAQYGGVDGYLIWDLSTRTPGKDQDSVADAKTIPTPTTAAGPPVLWINTESDAARTRTTPDGPEYRLWELAGATHVDLDLWNYAAAYAGRDFGSKPQIPTCTYRPLSRIPTGYALDAGIADLTTWIETNTPPPSQPPLQYDSQGNISRDSYGNALGGVRLPDEAVPIAASGPENGGGCDQFVGHSIPFTPNVLRDLYPTHADYVAKFTRAANVAVAAGVMLPYDAQQAVAAAGALDVPPAVHPAAHGSPGGHVPHASCAARRAVWIRVPKTLRGKRVLSARISTAGHRAVSARGGQRVQLVLRRGISNKASVRIDLRLHAGKRVVQVRTYRMCR